MKRFLLQTILLLAIVSIGYILISLWVNDGTRESNDYLAALIQKHQRVENITGPTVIFAGGSNVAFGTNSKQIEEEFDVPVVNLGLHAGLGVAFILNEIKTVAEPGDVVFLSFEYLLEVGGEYELKELASTLYPPSAEYYSTRFTEEVNSRMNRTRKNIRFKFEKVVKRPHKIYSQKGFNEYGDILPNLINTHKGKLRSRLVFSYRPWNAVDVLNDYYDWAQENDICTYFLYPAYPTSEYKKNEKVLQQIHTFNSKKLKIPILNTPETFTFADTLFYDTVYHVNEKGRQKRMKQMIEIIRNRTDVMECLKNAQHFNQLKKTKED